MSLNHIYEHFITPTAIGIFLKDCFDPKARVQLFVDSHNLWSLRFSALLLYSFHVDSNFYLSTRLSSYLIWEKQNFYDQWGPFLLLSTGLHAMHSISHIWWTCGSLVLLITLKCQHPSNDSIKSIYLFYQNFLSSLYKMNWFEIVHLRHLHK